MKILVLTKRHTSAKDISREDVGRPYCLFAALRDAGHEVSFLLGDYVTGEGFDVSKSGIRCMVRPLGLSNVLSFRKALRRELSGGGYDLLIAEGDPIFALLGLRPCRETGVPLLYDIMDNYETYRIYRIPFFALLDRMCIKKARIVVCVTETLREKISPLRRDGVHVVGNGVDTELFRPMEKSGCRAALSLPPGEKIVGYFGHLVDYKGINVLLEADEILRAGGFRPLLLLAGQKHHSVKPGGENVVYRGLVPHREIPLYINACDAVVVPNPENRYTDYSFPLKVQEGIACGVPVVATSLRPVRELLGGDYPLLARPGDPRDLADRIRMACDGGRAGKVFLPAARSWIDMAKILDGILARELGR